MSIAVRRAIYGKLAGDTTLTNLLATPPSGYSKSIFYEVAPEGSTWPYVIFQKQAGTPRYALATNSANSAFDNEVWTIKAVENSSRDGGSVDVAEAIATRLSDLLTDGTISISGKTQLYLRRESDLDYAEVRDGVTYRHAGAMFRLIYTT